MVNAALAGIKHRKFEDIQEFLNLLL